MNERTMGLSEAERERYADIVLGYLDGDYTLDPLDAGHIASDVIAAYQQDQQARLDAMHAVVDAADLQRSDMTANGGFTFVVTSDLAALDEALTTYYDFVAARDQEARDASE